MTPDILLVAVNARYGHCSHAARSLLANLGPLAGRAALLETDLDVTPHQLAAQVAERGPRVAGFCVYLWNVRLVEAAARILRAVAPGLRLAAGGPELTEGYANAALFDAAVAGEGETAFRRLCEAWLGEASGDRCTTHSAQRSTLNIQRSTLNVQRSTLNAQGAAHDAPAGGVTVAGPEDPASLALPDGLYTDEDLERRTVYVEASRGCPYACSYCTSSGTGLRLLPLARLLPALDRLWQRGLRRYKFIDRSFNAPAAHACAVLDFFLARAAPGLSLHLEINPERLHPDIVERLAAFPRRALHLEAGVQTLTPAAAAAAGRSADTARTLDNLRVLTRQTGAAVHADLLIGLPGEGEADFARGFDTLVAACDPPELQVNLLKGLPGTRLAREAGALGLVFSPEPPYELLRSRDLDFAALLRLQRFARTWELVHNRGRFPRAEAALRAAAGQEVFRAFAALAERIRAEEGRFHALGLPRLGRLLRDHLADGGGLAPAEAEALVAADLNGGPRER